jgi:hypothetical protein
MDLHDLPVHPRFDEHTVEGLHGSEAGEKDRDVGAADFRRDDGNGRRGPRRRRCAGGEPQRRRKEIGRASAGKEQKRYERPASHSVSELAPGLEAVSG